MDGATVRESGVSDLRRLVADWIGSAFLLAAIVGSGIMAEKLAGGNVALALLANAIATGAIAGRAILILAPVSGAHFNPAVSLAFALRGELPWLAAAEYIAAQIVGGVLGVWIAHLMFRAAGLGRCRSRPRRHGQNGSPNASRRSDCC